MLQEWRLNIDAGEYKWNIDADLYEPSEKKKFNGYDIDDYWPTSMKETIQWFTFIAIMEYTANIMEKDNGLISSLLNVFAMFELGLNYKEIRTSYLSGAWIVKKKQA